MLVEEDVSLHLDRSRGRHSPWSHHPRRRMADHPPTPFQPPQPNLPEPENSPKRGILSAAGRIHASPASTQQRLQARSQSTRLTHHADLRPQSLRVSEFGAPALDGPCPLHWIFKEPAKAGAPNADKPFPTLTSDALASVSVSQPSHLQSLLCPGINLSVLRQ